MFRNLKHLSLKNTRITSTILNKIKNNFPALEEIILSHNNLQDFGDLTIAPGELPHLKRLDVSNNRISDCNVLRIFQATKIEKLNLSHNNISNLDISSFMPQLTHLSISNNNIEDFSVLAELSRFSNLLCLRFLDNPLFSLHDKTHLRCLVIASCRKLKTLNGSDISREEKRDCEIHYLKTAFHDYFKFKNVNKDTYDLADFEAWAPTVYPVIDFYIKKFGNPYPIEERNYLEPITNAPKNQDFPINKLVVPVDKSRFVSIAFCNVDKTDKPVKKKFPRSTDIGYLRTFIKMTFKLKKDFKMFLNDVNMQNQKLDNVFKKLEDYTDSNEIEIVYQDA